MEEVIQDNDSTRHGRARGDLKVVEGERRGVAGINRHHSEGLKAFPFVPVERKLSRAAHVVVAQAQKTWFKLKALLSFSQSKFETRCFQDGVKLALPYHVERG